MKGRRVHFLPAGRKRPLCKSPGTGVSSDPAATTCPRCIALARRELANLTPAHRIPT